MHQSRPCWHLQLHAHWSIFISKKGWYEMLFLFFSFICLNVVLVIFHLFFQLSFLSNPSLFTHVRGVARGGPGGLKGEGPRSEFGSSVNPIPTRGSRLCPPHYCLYPRIWKHIYTSSCVNTINPKLCLWPCVGLFQHSWDPFEVFEYYTTSLKSPDLTNQNYAPYQAQRFRGWSQIEGNPNWILEFIADTYSIPNLF